jgi:hypothetical protein
MSPTSIQMDVHRGDIFNERMHMSGGSSDLGFFLSVLNCLIDICCICHERKSQSENVIIAYRIESSLAM